MTLPFHPRATGGNQMNSFTDTHTQKVNRGNLDFFTPFLNPKVIPRKRTRCRKLSPSECRAFPGNTRHLLTPDARSVQVSGCSAICTDLNQAASLHPRREGSVTERPLSPHAETGAMIAVGSQGADVHQITTD